jgi:YegS/Rv2252/BmrU family lipid kinase
MKKIKFIINPKSGMLQNSRQVERLVDGILGSAKISFDISYTGKPGEATELARDAAKEMYPMVAAVGGDGTINEILNGLVNSNTTLAIVPAGSGNGIAHNLKIPEDKKEAIKLLINPVIKKLDVGRINEHYFLNVAGFGLDALISKNFEEIGIRGPLTYFFVGTKTFLNFKATPATIKFNETEIKMSPLVVTVANAPEYGVGAVISPDAVPDDGYLDLVILEPISLWKAIWNVYRLFNGNINRIKEYHHYRVKTVEIFREEAGVIEVDGNPHFDGSHLTVKIIPQKINVVVGPDFHKRESDPVSDNN